MLCSQCEAIFTKVKTAPPGEWTGEKPRLFGYPDQTDVWAGPHHTGLESFLSAVKASCYICSTILRDYTAVTRNRAQEFRIFYEIRADNSSDEANVLTRRYSLEFTIELVQGTTSAAKPQVFECNGVFKVLPIKEISVPIKTIGLTPNTFSSECEKQVRQWLSNCDEKHQDCKQNGSVVNRYPSRLLKIKSTEEDSFRLQEFDEKASYPKYVTLSHCWRAGMTTQLTKQTLNQLLTTDYPIRDLPKRFVEAVQIARWIGVSYIWIDALCIVQDSQDDWLQQSAKMGDIYANSYCTIAATSDDKRGCFIDRIVSLVAPHYMADPRSTDQTMARTHVLGYDDFWSNSLSNSALHSRGWVLQERLLSPRTIYFGQEQIFWECRTKMACEAYPQGLPEQFRNQRTRAWREPIHLLALATKQRKADESQKNAFGRTLLSYLSRLLSFHGAIRHPEQVYSTWSKTIERYMECKLSYDRDKLVALSGIAQEVAKATKERYLAGLWENPQLAESMLWYVLSRRQADHSPSERPLSTGNNGYRAPSWSWASLEAKLVWNWPAGCDKVLIEILRTDIRHRTEDQMSLIDSAEMSVRGHLFEASLDIANRGDETPQENGSYSLKIRRDPSNDEETIDTVTELQSMEPTIYLDTPLMPIGSAVTAYLLPVCEGWKGRSGTKSMALAGLLLKKAKISTSTLAKYERIGIFGLDQSQAKTLCGVRSDGFEAVNRVLCLRKKVETTII